MHKEKKDKHFITKPYYDGGSKAMKAFLAKQMRYPKEAIAEKTEGTVHVRFEIGKDGKVIDTQIIAGIGNGCDEEAQRIVKLLQFTMPNKQQKARFHKTIQIHFRLPKKKAVKQTQMKYTYVTATPKATSKPKKIVYTYTIPKQS